MDIEKDQISEEDIERIMQHPLTIIGTDGAKISQMPRGIGTYPRVLGRYVREKNVLSLEEAIRKMTLLPAEKIGLKNKGIIKEGYDADLVIFDPNTIIDTADFTDTKGKNKGIKYVLINGNIALKDDKYLGTPYGTII